MFASCIDRGDWRCTLSVSNHPEGPTSPERASEKLKPLVLVVEDDTSLATMLRYNLEREGFRVESRRRPTAGRS
jgi:PleD family two-component response regulator